MDEVVMARENRIMIMDVKESIGEIKGLICKLDSRMTELFNHQSSRWPKEAVWVMSVFTAVVSAVLTYTLTKFLIGG